MKSEELKVANIKCNGCATTIKNELLKINGIVDAIIDIDNDAVTVQYENVDRQIIIDKLHSLGYPEATEDNGLLLQLKSTVTAVAKNKNLIILN